MKLSVTLTIVFSLLNFVCAYGISVDKEKDCIVYNTKSEGQNGVVYKKSTNGGLQIGFLHCDHNHLNEHIQIFIYHPQDEKRYLLIYINSWSNISLWNEDNILASAKLEKEHLNNPFWNYIVISITADEESSTLVSVSRPGEMVPLLNTIVNRKIPSNRFDFKIHSKQPIQLTFNCASECPFFGKYEHNTEPFSIEMYNSFFLDILPAKFKRSQFARQFDYSVNISLEGGYYHLFNQTRIFKTMNDIKLRCVISNESTIAITWDHLYDVRETFPQKIISVEFNVLKNTQNLWTFNCNPTYRLPGYQSRKTSIRHLLATPTVIQSTKIKSVQADSKLKENNAAIITWTLSFIALCCLVTIITAILLKRQKLDETQTPNVPEIKISSSTPPVPQKNSFRKSITKVSFKRKQPEESVAPSEDYCEVSPNNLTVSDQFYPLEIITDDDQSDNDLNMESIKTRCTVIDENDPNSFEYKDRL